MWKSKSLQQQITLTFLFLVTFIVFFLSALLYYFSHIESNVKKLIQIYLMIDTLVILIALASSSFLIKKTLLPLHSLNQSMQKIGPVSSCNTNCPIKELNAFTTFVQKVKDEITGKDRLLEKKIKELTQIYDFYKLGSQTKNSREIINCLLGKFLEIMEVKHGFLFLTDRQTNCLEEVLTYGLEEEQIIFLEDTMSRKIEKKCLTRGMVFLAPPSQPEEKGFLCLPLYVENNLIAIVGADDLITRRSFTQGPQTMFFLTLANQLTFFIERIYLYQILEQKLLQRKNELNALLKVSRIANQNMDINTILKMIISTTVNIMNSDKGIIILLNEDEDKLIFQAYHGLNRNLLNRVNNLSLQKNLLTFVKEGKSLLIEQIEEEEDNELIRELIKNEVVSFYLVPLRTKEKLLGSLVIFSSYARSYGEEEKEIYHSLANQAAITIENSQLYDHLQQAYLETIRSLVRAVEAKDAYTKGHAERVARYSVAIGQELDMDKDFLEKIEVAAILHDIGKIGIPELVLVKPGKLTEEEFTIMQSHPYRGQQILQPVTFEQDIVDGVYCHHERLDGKGYPIGLSGKEIPLIARILAVADAFDAMTSNRPYRSSLPMEEAIAELKRGYDSQFDGAVVDAFLQVINKKEEIFSELGRKEKIVSVS